MFRVVGKEKSRVFSGRAALGMDGESYGSPGEEGPCPQPRTVAEVVMEKRRGRICKEYAHSQILRIRAEDSHLGEDVAHLMLCFRPILPASPLSGKNLH